MSANISDSQRRDSGLKLDIDSNGDYCVSGSAGLFPNAASATHLVVHSRDVDTDLAISFHCKKETPGIVVDPDRWQALRSAAFAQIHLKNVSIPKDNVFSSYQPSYHLFDLVVAAAGLGIAQSALNAAARYASERKQFGKAIAEFQAIQWKIADSATQLDAARLCVLDAAWKLDHGEQVAQIQSARLISMRASMMACDHALQIHGGNGFTKEYPIERAYRDVAMLAELGSSNDHLRKYIALKHLARISA